MTNITDKKIKVAFFGTSDRSTEILNSLKNNFDFRFCVTKLDAKVGRKQILTPSGVKTWAVENSVPFIEVESLKNENIDKVLELVNKEKVDYIIVADFSFIIPQQILDNDSSTLINVHFSLLPMYRGASPVQFAILNGDPTTGVTFQLVHKKMDMGDIICQILLDILPNENSDQLYKRLFSLTATKIPEVIIDFHTGALTPVIQDETKSSYTYSKTKPSTTQILKEDARIDWTRYPIVIHRMVKAFYPWPVAWTTLEDIQNQKIMSNYEIKDEGNLLKRAKIIDTEYLPETKTLRILKIQVEGSKETDFQSFMNGYFKTK